jgi:hypothetical protein
MCEAAKQMEMHERRIRQDVLTCRENLTLSESVRLAQIALEMQILRLEHERTCAFCEGARAAEGA